MYFAHSDFCSLKELYCARAGGRSPAFVFLSALAAKFVLVLGCIAGKSVRNLCTAIEPSRRAFLRIAEIFLWVLV